MPKRKMTIREKHKDKTHAILLFSIMLFAYFIFSFIEGFPAKEDLRKLEGRVTAVDKSCSRGTCSEHISFSFNKRKELIELYLPFSKGFLHVGDNITILTTSKSRTGGDGYRPYDLKKGDTTLIDYRKEKIKHYIFKMVGAPILSITLFLWACSRYKFYINNYLNQHPPQS